MYVEGDTLIGDPDSGRPPVKVGGIDDAGNVQAFQLDDTGAMVIAGSVTSTGTSDSPSWQTTLTTKQLIRGTAGVLGGVYSMYNPNNGQDIWLQFFDAATTGAVTLGSTAPVVSLYIPSLSAYDGSYARAISFGSGIVAAATTTATGSTAPTASPYGTIAHAAAS